MNRNPSTRNRLAAALRTALLAFSLALLLPAPAAFADNLREVAERVAREHDAKVISAREVERRGRKIYVIRILTRDGVVKTIRVPAGDRSISLAMPDFDRTFGRQVIGYHATQDPSPASQLLRQPGCTLGACLQANNAVTTASSRDRLIRHPGNVHIVMPGPDRASSARSVGPGRTLQLTGLPIKPAMTRGRVASGNWT